MTLHSGVEIIDIVISILRIQRYDKSITFTKIRCVDEKFV